jgi:hypothetical protein
MRAKSFPMKHILSFTFLLLIPLLGIAKTSLPKNRSLIAVVNLLDHSTRHKWLYKFEDNHAAKLIEKKSKKNYSEIVILTKQDATVKNFILELKGLSEKAPENQIDMIFYIHGRGPQSADGAVLCFSGKPCVPIAELSQMIRETVPSTQLGFLYSDACWGETHLDEMMNAGFKVAAGSRKVDANHTSDLRRFLKWWNQGRSFQDSIDFANRNPISKIKDSILGKDADSFKTVRGQMSLSWFQD